MDFIVDLAINFWQWTVVIILILIGFVASIFDGQGEKRVGFKYSEMPHMKPVKIETADKGFGKQSGCGYLVFESGKFVITFISP